MNCQPMMHKKALPQTGGAGVTVWVYPRIEFVDRTICLSVKTASQNIVNQSENCYGWDNYTEY